MDKHNNKHRKQKLMVQAALNSDQQSTLEIVKRLKNISSNSELIRILLSEEEARLKKLEKI